MVVAVGVLNYERERWVRWKKVELYEVPRSTEIVVAGASVPERWG